MWRSQACMNAAYGCDANNADSNNLKTITVFVVTFLHYPKYRFLELKQVVAQLHSVLTC